MSEFEIWMSPSRSSTSAKSPAAVAKRPTSRVSKKGPEPTPKKAQKAPAAPARKAEKKPDAPVASDKEMKELPAPPQVVREAASAEGEVASTHEPVETSADEEEAAADEDPEDGGDADDADAAAEGEAEGENHEQDVEQGGGSNRGRGRGRGRGRKVKGKGKRCEKRTSSLKRPAADDAPAPASKKQKRVSFDAPAPKAKADPKAKAKPAPKPAPGAAAKDVIETADADADEADLTSTQRRALWMQYLRSRQGKYVKGCNDKCPPELLAKATAEPGRYFSMWLKAKKNWGKVMLIERKKTRLSKRSKGAYEWLTPTEIQKKKGKKESAEWILALQTLAENLPEDKEQYVKTHPTLGVLDPTGTNINFMLFRVPETFRDEVSDEEQDESIREFKGNMADAPTDAFDDDESKPSGTRKTSRHSSHADVNQVL